MNAKEWLGENNQIGIDIFENKYRHGNETVEEFANRVSGGDKELAQLILDKKFLFGGRVLANRGIEGSGNYYNCFSDGYVPDSMNGILDTVKTLGTTYKAQGGQGISLSKVRPEGTPIGDHYKSDGIVPFMRLFNSVTETVSQGGSRKGALMMSLDIRHKEAEKFITIKSQSGEIEKANLSLEIDDVFMQAVEKYYETGEVVTLHEQREYSGHKIEYDIVPIKLYKLMMETVYDWGEPGCIFTNRFRNYNLMEFDPEYNVETSNPSLRAGTKVWTTEGLIPIEQLEGKEFTVRTIAGQLATAECKLSGRKKQLYKIVLDNDKEIYCTEQHKWPVYDAELNTYCKEKTCDLQSGDQLYCSFHSTTLAHDLSHLISIKDCQATDLYEDVWDIHVFDDTHTFELEDCFTGNCGEQPLKAKTSCNLGSLNLYEFVQDPFTQVARFDRKEFKRAIKIAIRALDDIVDENMSRIPMEEYRENSRNYRNIGLGVMGYADMLMALGLTYGSNKALQFTNELFYMMLHTAVQTSNQLAEEKGAFPKYTDQVLNSSIIFDHFNSHTIEQLKIDGLRNCSLLSIAPTGSIATMLGVSGGIEPEFALGYTRRTDNLGESYTVHAKVVNDYLNVWTDATTLPDYFVTSGEINWRNRVATQGAIQNYIDTAISSTVNLPKETTPEEIEQLYLEAWREGLKGITIFRDGCKRLGILLTDESEMSRNENKKTPSDKLERGTIIMANDDVVGKKRKLDTGCGSTHCTAFFDPVDGNLLEVYLSRGSQGTCVNYMTGLSRMISLAARGGIHIDDIIDQLNSCGVCPSYAVRTAKYHDTSKGACCPIAVGYALKDMYEEMQEELGLTDSKYVENYVINNHNTTDNKSTTNEQTYIPCPECGEPLTFEGGCNICKACGYSKCD